MILLKCFGIAWMLSWFFLLFKIIVRQVNNGADLFGSIFALIFVWFLIGFLPIAIIKFGWSYIGRG